MSRRQPAPERPCEVCRTPHAKPGRTRAPRQLRRARPAGRIGYRGTCEVCQGEIRRPDYKPRRTCSAACTKVLWARERPVVTGAEHPQWKGGLVKKGGYLRRRMPDHPAADAKGYVAEHRLVMEAKLGRLLERREMVHHRNGIKTDNRPENLEVVTYATHRGEVTCPCCRYQFAIK